MIFGTALDRAGGERARSAWFAAFATIALGMLLGPLVVRRLIGRAPLERCAPPNCGHTLAAPPGGRW